MKASYQWIKHYLPGDESSPEEMMRSLTMTGTEVESFEPVGDDFQFDIGVTSNRVDSLCHLGLAREVAASRGLSWVGPDCKVDASGGATAEVVGLKVEDAERCPRYTAMVIEGVKVGPSPDWLVRCLEAIGLRPVNNIVDVTNYVLFELNQPLHAFDLDRLKGPEIVVRRARPGEKLRAINDKEYALDGEDLVIADAERPVALGGVMGGLDSEVGEGTTRILLEAAYFTQRGVRRTSRRHQLFSDSSYRFERGIDRASVLVAAQRAARLILEVAGGTLRTAPLDAGGEGEAPAGIALRMAAIERICGFAVPRDEVRRILEALDCGVEDRDDATLQVTPPTFRADLRREIDLVEEVIRIHGFEHVSETTGMKVMTPRRHAGRDLRERLKDRMVALGFCETVTPNFVPEGLAATVGFLTTGPGVTVVNPVRAGEGALRLSLLPSLLKVWKHNLDQGAAEGLRFFEVSSLHELVEGRTAVPTHRAALGFLCDGELRDARGVVEEITGFLGLAVRVAPCDSGHLDARGRAELFCGERRLGVIGYPTSELIRAYGIKAKQPPVYGELDLAVLAEEKSATKVFGGLPKYPAIERDLTLVLDESATYGEVMAALEALTPKDLESTEFVGEFRGKQVGKGRKSLTFRMVFRSSEGTLKSAPIDEEIEHVVDTMKQRFGAEIRGA